MESITQQILENKEILYIIGFSLVSLILTYFIVPTLRVKIFLKRYRVKGESMQISPKALHILYMKTSGKKISFDKFKKVAIKNLDYQEPDDEIEEGLLFVNKDSKIFDEPEVKYEPPPGWEKFGGYQ